MKTFLVTSILLALLAPQSKSTNSKNNFEFVGFNDFNFNDELDTRPWLQSDDLDIFKKTYQGLENVLSALGLEDIDSGSSKGLQGSKKMNFSIS